MIDYNRFLSRGAATMQESAIRKMGALGLRVPDLISFAPGFPAPEVFAWDEFRDVAQPVLDGTDASVLQYGPTRGYRPLVEALPHIPAERGIRATPEDIIVTTGSQQALDLCARVFIDPGDVILVELPTHTGAITAFRNVQARFVAARAARMGGAARRADRRGPVRCAALRRRGDRRRDAADQGRRRRRPRGVSEPFLEDRRAGLSCGVD